MSGAAAVKFARRVNVSLQGSQSMSMKPAGFRLWALGFGPIAKRRVRVLIRRLGCLVWLVALLPAASCTDLLTANRSSSILWIERIGAARGGTADAPIPTYLQSDVLTNGGVFEDTARVTTRLALKDPGTSENPASPTPANFVTITRYRIVYKREGGRNTPGVDVPYPWDGAVTFTTLSGAQTAEFILVRASAKLEPPLIGLRNLGGSVIIGTIAEITFYGHDQAGQSVTAVGTITVDFADWADPA